MFSAAPVLGPSRGTGACRSRVSDEGQGAGFWSRQRLPPGTCVRALSDAWYGGEVGECTPTDTKCHCCAVQAAVGGE